MRLITVAAAVIALSGCASGPMSNDEVTQWIHENCGKGAWPRFYPVPDEGHKPAWIVQLPMFPDPDQPLKSSIVDACGEPGKLDAVACAMPVPGRGMGTIWLPEEDPLRSACHEQAHINGTLRCREHDENGYGIRGTDCGWHYTVKPEDLEPIWRVR